MSKKSKDKTVTKKTATKKTGTKPVAIEQDASDQAIAEPVVPEQAALDGAALDGAALDGAATQPEAQVDGAISPTRMIVIINPASGSAGDDFRPRVEEALRSRGADFEVLETTPEVGGGPLAAQAVKDGATHIVACGGDGTVMAVVNGLGKTDKGIESEQSQPEVTLSIIPGGTANLLAAALKIPTDVDAAAAVVVAGEDRVLDLGHCGKHLFALGLGLGLTERLVSQASAQQKEKLGKLAYALAMLKELGARPHTFSFKLDNHRPRRARGVAIVIANAGEIGGGMKFAPNAKMDDGKLDLCILHRFYFRDFLRMVARGLFGQLQKDRAISFYQARRVEIRSNPPLDLQIDGEEVDQEIPLVAEVEPGALRVRVPIEKAQQIDKGEG